MPEISLSEKPTAVAGIIPAAGLSSRMQAFKPLLGIAGRPLLLWTLTSLAAGGVDHLELILGYQASAVKTQLEGWPTPSKNRQNPNSAAPSTRAKAQESSQQAAQAPAPAPSMHITVNHDYATSDMLHSLQLGLEQLLFDPHSYTAACILPGDIAAIAPASIRALLAAHRRTPEQTLRLSYAGQCGHPLLAPRSLWTTIVNFNGSGGLRAALAQTNILDIPVDDPGVLLDADNAADLARLESQLLDRLNEGEDRADFSTL